MIISGSAVMVMELTMERWRRRFARLIGRSGQRVADASANGATVLPSSLDLFDAAGHVMRQSDRGTQREDAVGMNAPPAAPLEPLTANERKARATAVRALMRARDGQFDQARSLFAEAALLDSALDLSTVPTFWELSRNGQQAAVEGYQLAGREDDAVVLASELAYTFRPKLVRRQPLGAAPASGD